MKLFQRILIATSVAVTASQLVLISETTAQQTIAKSIKWKVKQLAIDRNEGIDIADFNQDGKPDIVAGRNWYAAPDFLPRPLRTIEDWNGYVQSNGDFAIDVDRDGWVDVIAGSFIPTEVYWYRNPGEKEIAAGKLWEKKLLVDTKQSQNEGVLMADLNNDGSPQWIANSWKKDNPLTAWEMLSTEEGPTLKPTVIGPRANGHGMAVGDINNDGHTDVFVGMGWYENPGTAKMEPSWKYHADWNEHASVPCIIHDWDADGKNDLLVGNGHDFGITWWRQLDPDSDGKLQWDKKVIDQTYSQPHCLHLADLDGDGTPEVITGKRVEAHNGKDPGGKMPPCLYYYRWDQKAMTFHRHAIDEGHIGTGLQIRTADLNDDGKIDIAVAGKSGTYLIFNQGIGK